MRGKTKPDETLGRSVTVRVSAQQYAAMEAEAKSRGVSVSTVIRDRVSGTTSMVAMSPEDAQALRENTLELMRVRRELNAIGVNLNQVVRDGHKGLMPTDAKLRDLYRKLVALWNDDRKMWRR